MPLITVPLRSALNRIPCPGIRLPLTSRSVSVSTDSFVLSATIVAGAASRTDFPLSGFELSAVSSTLTAFTASSVPPTNTLTGAVPATVPFRFAV